MQQGRRNRAVIPVLSALAVGAAGVGIAFATLSGGGQEAAGSAHFSNPNAAAQTATPTSEAAAAGAAAAGGAATGAQTVVCPSVADKLPDIPAAAQAEVENNLRQLENQIAEANNRLATSAGEGGPNFVQNAILGPLEDKRVAAINRIATAIGRVADRPIGLEVLAPCTVSQ